MIWQSYKPRNMDTAYRKKISVRIFGCTSFDTFSLLKLIGGLNKGRPNEKGFKNAIVFFEKKYYRRVMEFSALETIKRQYNLPWEKNEKFECTPGT